MVQAYKEYWKRFADFNGRTSVGGYWWAFLANVLVSIVVSVVAGLILPVLSTLFAVANLIPGIAIAVRRLRDAGYKWYNLFWSFVPVVGFVILIILLVKPSK